MKQIHGHEVMQMMLASGKVYTKASLTEDIERQFGKDTRFHTCSAENLTAADMVDFLESKGKFISRDGGLQTSPELMCKH